MGAPDRFTIDSDELDEVIADVSTCEGALDTLTQDLTRQMKVLQSVWEGLAADAHHEAHEEWTQGMETMREALRDLRAAARVAHGNYTGAADTNVSMWEQIR